MKKFTLLIRAASLMLLFSILGSYSVHAHGTNIEMGIAVSPPLPKLGEVQIQPTCVGEFATIVLIGLNESTTGIATYKINGGSAQNLPYTSTSDGKFTFVTSIVATMANNGATLQITKLKENGETKTFPNKIAVFEVNPIPELMSVTVEPVCEGNSASIVLSGLVPNSTGKATYKFGGQTIVGQSATATGDQYIIHTPALPLGANGQAFEILSLKFDGTNCTTNFNDKSVNLVVNAKPTLESVNFAPVCEGSEGTIILKGLVPFSTGKATYTFAGQTIVGPSGTADVNGEFSISTGILPASANNQFFEITKLEIDGTNCSTSFTGKKVKLVVNSKPTLASVTANEVCFGNATTIVLSGLIPNSTGVATYTIGGGAPQTGTSGTASGTTFNIDAGILPLSADGLDFKITKLSIDETGCVALFDDKFVTLGVNPLPTIEISGTPVVCSGESFSLTASGATSYAWTGPVGSKNGFSAAKYTSSNATIGKSLNNLAQYHRIGEYTVIGTDDNGCANTASETVGVSPILTLNVIPVIPPACEGSDFTINSLATITNVTKSNNFPFYALTAGNTSDITYAWSGPNGYNSASSNASISNASMTDAGEYSLTISTQEGCEKSKSVTVNVNALPTIELQESVAVCLGSDITLTAESNGTVLSWSKNGNVVGFGASYTISSADMSDGGMYTFTAVSNSLCTSEQSIELVVNPLPEVTVSSNSPVCEGASLELSADGGTSYAWSGPDFTSEDQNPSLTANLEMTGSYTVTVTDDNGCMNSASVDVMVNPLPTIEISGTPVVCSGESFSLTASGATSYAWTGPVGSKNGFSAAKYTSSNATIGKSLNNLAQYHRIGEYTVIGTDDNGCANTASETVGVSPILTLNVIPVIPPACEGSDFTINSLATITNVTKSNNFPFYALTAGNTSDITYAWSGPNGYNSASSNASISNASMTDAGEYSLTISTQEGCEKSKSVTVNVNALPTIELAENEAVCEGNDITLSAASNGTVLSWFKNGSLVGLGASLTISSADMSDAGTYTFTAVNNSLCTSSQDIELTVNPLPTLTSVSVDPVCEGSSASIVLTGLIANSTGYATYKVGNIISIGDVGTADGVGNFTITTTPLPLGANNAVFEILKITSEFGCETTFTGQSVTLKVNKKPTLTSVSIDPVCEGGTTNIVLSGLVPNSTGSSVYKIGNQPSQIGYGTASSAGKLSIPVTNVPLLANGVFVEILELTIDGTECTSTFVNKKAPFVVHAKPTLTSVTAAPIYAGESATIVLSGLVSNSTGFATVKFGANAPVDGAVGTAIGTTYSFQIPALPVGASGTIVSVTKLTSNYGCVATFTDKSATLVITEGPSETASESNPGKILIGENPNFENDVQAKADFIMYPNPVNDILNIQTDLDIQSVDFLNVNGQKVLTSNQKQINVSLLPAGVYIVRVQDKSNNVVIKKVVVK